MTILRVNDVSSPSGAGVSSGRAVVTGVILVIGVLVAVFPAFAGYGYWAHGEIGVAAAAVAAVVCLVGGLAGWAAMIPFRGPQAVNGVLLGMLVRMTVPLAAALLLFLRGGPLVRAGLVEMLVAYYLIALILDTVLSVRRVQQISRRETKA